MKLHTVYKAPDYFRHKPRSDAHRLVYMETKMAAIKMVWLILVRLFAILTIVFLNSSWGFNENGLGRVTEVFMPNSTRVRFQIGLDNLWSWLKYKNKSENLMIQLQPFCFLPYISKWPNRGWKENGSFYIVAEIVQGKVASSHKDLSQFT